MLRSQLAARLFRADIVYVFLRRNMQVRVATLP